MFGIFTSYIVNSILSRIAKRRGIDKQTRKVLTFAGVMLLLVVMIFTIIFYIAAAVIVSVTLVVSVPLILIYIFVDVLMTVIFLINRISGNDDFDFLIKC